MIVDCHTHIWDAMSQLGRCADPARLKCYGSAAKTAGAYDLQAAMEPVDVCFVLGFRSNALGVDVPNKLVSEFALQYQDKVMGFGCVDPACDDVPEEAKRIREEHRLAGFVLSPAGQGFHPASTSVIELYDYAANHRMPVIIHQGAPFGGQFCEFSNPTLWGGVFREYPQVKFIFTDMGWPWQDQTLLMAAEFPNIYIDLAGLATKTLTAYQVLVKAFQLGLIDKLLLASDFPAAGAAATIEAIYSINQMAGGTNLPTIPRQKLREIVERNVVKDLGLEPLASMRLSTSEKN